MNIQQICHYCPWRCFCSDCLSAKDNPEDTREDVFYRMHNEFKCELVATNKCELVATKNNINNETHSEGKLSTSPRDQYILR